MVHGNSSSKRHLAPQEQAAQERRRPCIRNLLKKASACWTEYLEAPPGRRGRVHAAAAFSVWQGCRQETIERCQVSSEDLGCSLWGALEVSATSGRLQFADATGAVDAVAIGRLDAVHYHHLLKVGRFHLVLEGVKIPPPQGPGTTHREAWGEMAIQSQPSPLPWADLFRVGPLEELEMGWQEVCSKATPGDSRGAPAAAGLRRCYVVFMLEHTTCLMQRKFRAKSFSAWLRAELALCQVAQAGSASATPTPLAGPTASASATCGGGRGGGGPTWGPCPLPVTPGGAGSSREHGVELAVLLVTHKHPLSRKVQARSGGPRGQVAGQGSSSFFARAVILPFTLVVVDTCPHEGDTSSAWSSTGGGASSRLLPYQNASSEASFRPCPRNDYDGGEAAAAAAALRRGTGWGWGGRGNQGGRESVGECWLEWAAYPAYSSSPHGAPKGAHKEKETATGEPVPAAAAAAGAGAGAAAAGAGAAAKDRPSVSSIEEGDEGLPAAASGQPRMGGGGGVMGAYCEAATCQEAERCRKRPRETAAAGSDTSERRSKRATPPVVGACALQTARASVLVDSREVELLVAFGKEPLSWEDLSRGGWEGQAEFTVQQQQGLQQQEQQRCPEEGGGVAPALPGGGVLPEQHALLECAEGAAALHLALHVGSCYLFPTLYHPRLASRERIQRGAASAAPSNDSGSRNNHCSHSSGNVQQPHWQSLKYAGSSHNNSYDHNDSHSHSHSHSHGHSRSHSHTNGSSHSRAAQSRRGGATAAAAAAAAPLVIQLTPTTPVWSFAIGPSMIAGTAATRTRNSGVGAAAPLVSGRESNGGSGPPPGTMAPTAAAHEPAASWLSEVSLRAEGCLRQRLAAVLEVCARRHLASFFRVEQIGHINVTRHAAAPYGERWTAAPAPARARSDPAPAISAPPFSPAAPAAPPAPPAPVPAFPLDLIGSRIIILSVQGLVRSVEWRYGPGSFDAVREQAGTPGMAPGRPGGALGGGLFGDKACLFWLADAAGTHSVPICVDASRYLLPLELTPGALVSVSRALFSRLPSGRGLLECTPSTLVTVDRSPCDSLQARQVSASEKVHGGDTCTPKTGKGRKRRAGRRPSGRSGGESSEGSGLSSHGRAESAGAYQLAQTHFADRCRALAARLDLGEVGRLQGELPGGLYSTRCRVVAISRLEVGLQCPPERDTWLDANEADKATISPARWERAGDAARCTDCRQPLREHSLEILELAVTLDDGFGRALCTARGAVALDLLGLAPAAAASSCQASAARQHPSRSRLLALWQSLLPLACKHGRVLVRASRVAATVPSMAAGCPPLEVLGGGARGELVPLQQAQQQRRRAELLFEAFVVAACQQAPRIVFWVQQGGPSRSSGEGVRADRGAEEGAAQKVHVQAQAQAQVPITKAQMYFAGRQLTTCVRQLAQLHALHVEPVLASREAAALLRKLEGELGIPP